MPGSRPAALSITGLSAQDPGTGAAIDGLTLDVRAGEMAAIHDDKPERLHLLGDCLRMRRAPSRGTIVVAGTSTTDARDWPADRWSQSMVHDVRPAPPTGQGTLWEHLAREEQHRTGAKTGTRANAILDRTGLRTHAADAVRSSAAMQRYLLGLGSALVWDPTILLVEQPELTLSPAALGQFLGQTRQLAALEGRTVVVLTTRTPPAPGELATHRLQPH